MLFEVSVLVSAGGSKTCAPFTAILCSESSLLPIAEASHMGLTLVQSPRQSVSSRKTLYRDVRWLTTSEPVSAKVVPDDVSFSLEPALPDGRCFRPFLRWFHHPFFILRPMRCDRMGALSMYQSPRYPHGSISPRNLALALKRRFLEHRHRNPPPTGPITPRPKLEIHSRQENAENASILPALLTFALSGTGTPACALFP